MPIDPSNYKNPSDYMQAYQQDSKYKSQTPEMQQMINETMLGRWRNNQQARAKHDADLQKEYDLEYKGGTIPGSGARSWWIQNVNKPMQRGTEAALGGLFGGPQEMADVWNRPGDHPLLREATGFVPFFGAGTPEQQAMDAWMFLMNPGYKALGLAEEGGALGMRKLLGQVGVSTAAGALAYTPKAVAEGNPWAIAEGAGHGGLLGLVNVGGGLFGRVGENRVYTQGVGSTLDKNIPGVATDVKTTEDLIKLFHPGAQTEKWSIVSNAQKMSGERLADSTDKVMSKVGNQPYDWTFTEEEADALGRAKIKARGAQLAPRPAQPAFGRVPAIPGVAAHTYRFPSVKEAYNMVNDVEREGWTTYGELRNDDTGVAEAMRNTSRRLFDGLYTHVDNALGQTGDAGRWYLDHYGDKNARLYSHIFQTKGVIEKDMVVPSKLQNVVLDRYFTDILENGGRLTDFGGENPGKGFILSIMRGASPTAQRDVVGKLNMFMSVHPVGIIGKAFGGPVGALMGGMRIGGYPTLPRKAGQVAYEAGLTKMIMQMVFKVGANGFYHAMTDQPDGP